MASYSTNLLLSLLALGESGVHGFANWGEAVNSNLSFLEDAITETSDITVNTGDVTLSATEERSLFLNLSGTLTGSRSVLTNDRKGMWIVYNGCTLGGNTLTFKPISGTGATLAAGEYALFVCDGTNAIKVLSSVVAAGDIGSGTLAHERGGLEADVSAYDGLVKITGGATSAVAISAFIETLMNDADEAAAQATLGLVIGTDVADVDETHGQHTVWIPAGAMTARTTNGAASGLQELATNDVMENYLAFDASTEEGAQFMVQMPKSWDEGTIVAQFIWSHPSTTVNFGVVWSLAGVALADSDALDTAFGTAQTATDTGGTTDDVYISPETSAITIAGSPTAEELIVFQAKRVAANGSDTLAVDAYLIGVKIHYTTNASTDD